MIRLIRIMMILRITRIIRVKRMIERTRSSTSTRTGARTIINVTIAFQSQSKFCFIVLTNSPSPQLECQPLYQVGDLQLQNDLSQQHNIELCKYADIHINIK